MRYSAQSYERKRLEHRGIAQVRNQFDEDTTRPNLPLNCASFFVPLLCSNFLFFRASLEQRHFLILLSVVGMLMTMAILAVLRPKRTVSQALMYGLLGSGLSLMIFIGTMPTDQLRHFLRLG